MAEKVDAKKATIKGDAALGILKHVDRVYATRGQRVIQVDLRRDRPDRATLRTLLIGPSGNLRAPTLRVGRTLLVGFDGEMYDEVLR